MSTVITRSIEFDAGHRVLGHESKCAHLHGHRYKALISVTASRLDSIGRVVDYSVIKRLVGTWIDEHWDHNVLLNMQDPFVPLVTFEMNGREPYLIEGNPTAENMACLLFHHAVELLKAEAVQVQSVRIYETPNCWADYHGS